MPKTVLITGAAQGIGRATALTFARNGWRVGAYDVNSESLSSLVAEAGGLCDIVTGSLDVRDPEAWRRVLADLVGDAGLDVLINNAGVMRHGRFDTIALSEQTLTVEVNVLGVINGCHAAFPYLKRAHGHVINLCSASAIYGQSELATYSASKFAVRGLSEALDIEWARDGISVTALWPLFVNTQMVADVDIASTRALGVRLTPEDVAAAAWDAVQKRSKGLHRGVGLQSRMSMAAAAVVPSRVTRLVNRYIATH